MSSNSITGPLLAVHIKRIGDAEGEKATAVAKVRNAIKAAKADGIDTAQLANLMAALKANAHDLAARHNTFVDYMRKMNGPLADQMSLLTVEEVTEANTIANAETHGRRDGLCGKAESDNPYDVAGPAGQKWLAGYREGQAELLKGIAEYKPPEPDDEDGEE